VARGRWRDRRYTTDGWPTTLMLVNAIGFFAGRRITRSP
jgi:hypothetical protein